MADHKEMVPFCLKLMEAFFFKLLLSLNSGWDHGMYTFWGHLIWFQLNVTYFFQCFGLARVLIQMVLHCGNTIAEKVPHYQGEH